MGLLRKCFVGCFKAPEHELLAQASAHSSSGPPLKSTQQPAAVVTNTGRATNQENDDAVVERLAVCLFSCSSQAGEADINTASAQVQLACGTWAVQDMDSGWERHVQDAEPTAYAARLQRIIAQDAVLAVSVDMCARSALIPEVAHAASLTVDCPAWVDHSGRHRLVITPIRTPTPCLRILHEFDSTMPMKKPVGIVSGVNKSAAARSLLLASEVPYMLTLVSLEGGGVICQNELSKAYYGDLCGPSAACSPMRLGRCQQATVMPGVFLSSPPDLDSVVALLSGLMSQELEENPQVVIEALDEVLGGAEGVVWTRIMKVPAFLSASRPQTAPTSGALTQPHLGAHPTEVLHKQVSAGTGTATATVMSAGGSVRATPARMGTERTASATSQQVSIRGRSRPTTLDDEAPYERATSGIAGSSGGHHGPTPTSERAQLSAAVAGNVRAPRTMTKAMLDHMLNEASAATTPSSPTPGLLSVPTSSLAHSASAVGIVRPPVTVSQAASLGRTPAAGLMHTTSHLPLPAQDAAMQRTPSVPQSQPQLPFNTAAKSHAQLREARMLMHTISLPSGGLKAPLSIDSLGGMEERQPAANVAAAPSAHPLEGVGEQSRRLHVGTNTAAHIDSPGADMAGPALRHATSFPSLSRLKQSAGGAPLSLQRSLTCGNMEPSLRMAVGMTSMDEPLLEELGMTSAADAARRRSLVAPHMDRASWNVTRASSPFMHARPSTSDQINHPYHTHAQPPMEDGGVDAQDSLAHARRSSHLTRQNSQQAGPNMGLARSFCVRRNTRSHRSSLLFDQLLQLQGHDELMSSMMSTSSPRAHAVQACTSLSQGAGAPTPTGEANASSGAGSGVLTLSRTPSAISLANESRRALLPRLPSRRVVSLLAATAHHHQAGGATPPIQPHAAPAGPQVAHTNALSTHLQARQFGGAGGHTASTQPAWCRWMDDGMLPNSPSHGAGSVAGPGPVCSLPRRLSATSMQRMSDGSTMGLHAVPEGRDGHDAVTPHSPPTDRTGHQAWGAQQQPHSNPSPQPAAATGPVPVVHPQRGSAAGSSMCEPGMAGMLEAGWSVVSGKPCAAGPTLNLRARQSQEQAAGCQADHLGVREDSITSTLISTSHLSHGASPAQLSTLGQSGSHRNNLMHGVDQQLPRHLAALVAKDSGASPGPGTVPEVQEEEEEVEGHEEEEEEEEREGEQCDEGVQEGDDWEPGSDQRLGPLAEGADAFAWHEVAVKRTRDPATGSSMLLLVQRDVTERAQLENTLSELTEAQLAMLSQIFPRHVIEALSMGNSDNISVEQVAALAHSHRDVTVLVMDLVGFTSMSKELAPEDVIRFINHLFGQYDLLVEKHRVQKIDTRGDSFIIGCGILSPDEEGFNAVDDAHDAEEGARRVFAFAQDMLRVSRLVSLPHNGEPVSIRIGVHTGPCVSGLIGTKLPKWTVLGPTVNMAIQLETAAPFDSIHLSAAARSFLPADMPLVPEADFQTHTEAAQDGDGASSKPWYIWYPPEEWREETELPAGFFDGEVGGEEAQGAGDEVLREEGDGSGGALFGGATTPEPVPPVPLNELPGWHVGGLAGRGDGPKGDGGATPMTAVAVGNCDTDPPPAPQGTPAALTPLPLTYSNNSTRLSLPAQLVLNADRPSLQSVAGAVSTLVAIGLGSGSRPGSGLKLGSGSGLHSTGARHSRYSTSMSGAAATHTSMQGRESGDLHQLAPADMSGVLRHLLGGGERLSGGGQRSSLSRLSPAADHVAGGQSPKPSSLPMHARMSGTSYCSASAPRVLLLPKQPMSTDAAHLAPVLEQQRDTGSCTSMQGGPPATAAGRVGARGGEALQAQGLGGQPIDSRPAKMSLDVPSALSPLVFSPRSITTSTNHTTLPGVWPGGHAPGSIAAAVDIPPTLAHPSAVGASWSGAVPTLGDGASASLAVPTAAPDCGGDAPHKGTHLDAGVSNATKPTEESAEEVSTGMASLLLEDVEEPPSLTCTTTGAVAAIPSSATTLSLPRRTLSRTFSHTSNSPQQLAKAVPAASASSSFRGLQACVSLARQTSGLSRSYDPRSAGSMGSGVHHSLQFLLAGDASQAHSCSDQENSPMAAAKDLHSPGHPSRMVVSPGTTPTARLPAPTPLLRQLTTSSGSRPGSERSPAAVMAMGTRRVASVLLTAQGHHRQRALSPRHTTVADQGVTQADAGRAEQGSSSMRSSRSSSSHKMAALAVLLPSAAYASTSTHGADAPPAAAAPHLTPDAMSPSVRPVPVPGLPQQPSVAHGAGSEVQGQRAERGETGTALAQAALSSAGRPRMPWLSKERSAGNEPDMGSNAGERLHPLSCSNAADGLVRGAHPQRASSAQEHTGVDFEADEGPFVQGASQLAVVSRTKSFADSPFVRLVRLGGLGAVSGPGNGPGGRRSKGSLGVQQSSHSLTAAAMSPHAGMGWGAVHRSGHSMSAAHPPHAARAGGGASRIPTTAHTQSATASPGGKQAIYTVATVRGATEETCWRGSTLQLQQQDAEPGALEF